MKYSTQRQEEPQAEVVGYVADNDNSRTHLNPIMGRAKSGRLFATPGQNLMAIRTLNRMDDILSKAESEGVFPGWLEGNVSFEDRDYCGQSSSRETQGRSAMRVIDDYFNGTLECASNGNDRRSNCVVRTAGRFKFDANGIICGYRLNKSPKAGGDIWIRKDHKKYPDSIVTPRERSQRDSRVSKPGRISADRMAQAANDNFDERSCLTWLKARMSPEQYEAVYDATAGLGFGAIGTNAGFSGKQADAVGKDRVLCGILNASQLLDDWDDLSGCT